jgi:serine/threonine-protein kinase
MGEVYLAEQTSLHRQVALKVLRADRTESQSHLQRFKTEAMAAGNLNHNNIVQVYLIGETDGFHYIAQEFVDGRNLREHIQKKGILSAQVAIHVMRQVASALQKAGEAGIVHRDIKPENIMITRKGVVKIADFGLARLTLRDDINLTQVGMTMGTPTYMSPEQVHGQKVDQRSDIYSFGITAYHMLTGRPPFYGETALAVAVKHLKDKPLPLRDKRPDLPVALCDMVHKMIEKDPSKRYQHASQIIQDLKKISADIQQGGAGNIQLTEFETASHQVPASGKPFYQNRTYLVLSLILFLSSGFGVGWAMRTPNPFNSPAKTNDTLLDKPTAREQWEYALMLLKNKDAWIKVFQRFPDSPEATFSKEQLGILYLQDHDLEKATQIFRELEMKGITYKDSYTKGVAGKVIIESLKGNYSRSNTVLVGELQPYQKDFSGALVPWVSQAYKLNCQKLNENTNAAILDLFKPSENLDEKPVLQ